MRLIQFMLREHGHGRLLLMILIGAPAISYGLAGQYLSHAATLGRGEAPDEMDLFRVSVLIVFFTISQHWSWSYLSVLLERGAAAARMRILYRLRFIALGDLDRIGKAQIYASLSTHIRTMSAGGTLLMRAVMNASGVVVLLPIIAFISRPAFMLMILTLIGIGSIYALNFVAVLHQQAEERRLSDLFQAAFRDVIVGIKELKLHKAKSDAFLAGSLEQISQAARHAHTSVARRLQFNTVLHTIALFALAGTIVYVLPLLQHDQYAQASQVAMLFIFLNIGALRDLQVLASANQSTAQISKIETELHLAGLSHQSLPSATETRAAFESLAFDQITFRYPDDGADPGFAVGPLSFTIRAGTLTFIVGGNGSGKSTVMRLLTGLYPRQLGRILLNGEPADMARHGHLFSAIFADYHLFDRLYGMGEVDEAAFAGHLHELLIGDKTRFEHGRFSTLDLSSGQKKRIALAIARLEDKPVYVLDEWAADQDPDFRAAFYNDLLPELKALGKTVIAVVHDDRYEHVADQLLRLDRGTFRAQSEG